MTTTITIKTNTTKAPSFTKKAKINLMNLELTDESEAKNFRIAENDQLNNEYDFIRPTQSRVLKAKPFS